MRPETRFDEDFSC